MFSFRKPKIYLKTYFYSPHEIKFLKLNLQESMPYIDKLILCEFNRNHLGDKRDFIFDQYEDAFTSAEREKILYFPCDISHVISKGNNSAEIHENEKWMRGYFTSLIDLHNQDIVVSVDADEIIFAKYYPILLNQIGRSKPAIKLKLNQFFYKINYLWEGEEFIAPTIARYSFYKRHYPAQWRYDGELYPETVGAHFSWCMTIDQMINKIASYGHHYDFKHLMDKDILTHAVEKKEYPFDPQRKFNINVLDIQKQKETFPASLYTMLDQFEGLIGN